MAKYRFISMEPSGDGDHILTLEVTRGLFWKNKVNKRFIGNGTIWYQLPNFKRCSTSMECMLVEFWEKARWLKSPHCR